MGAVVCLAIDLAMGCVGEETGWGWSIGGSPLIALFNSLDPSLGFKVLCIYPPVVLQFLS